MALHASNLCACALLLATTILCIAILVVVLENRLGIDVPCNRPVFLYNIKHGGVHI